MDDIFLNIKNRILQIAEIKGITKEKFFSDLGISYANFKGKSKKSAISSKVLVEISAKFSDINVEWLLNGTGEIFRANQIASQIINQELTIKVHELEMKVASLERELLDAYRKIDKLKEIPKKSAQYGQSKLANELVEQK